jgi:hypothetical protein
MFLTPTDRQILKYVLNSFVHSRRRFENNLHELGLDNLDELEAFLAEPLSEAERRFLATCDRILAWRNPARLIEDALWAERFWRAVGSGDGRRQLITLPYA